MPAYDNDQLIPCYGFGDNATHSRKIFSFYPQDEPARKLDAVLRRYCQMAPNVDFSGPASFAPLIRHSMRIVLRSDMQFHILLILADGQISEGFEEETVEAIVTATKFPISIVVVGIGDGPWDKMREFDYHLPQRDWDNFHFVEFNQIFRGQGVISEKRREAIFALDALMEVPDQCRFAHRLMGPDAIRVGNEIVASIPDDIVIDPPPRYLRGVTMSSRIRRPGHQSWPCCKCQ